MATATTLSEAAGQAYSNVDAKWVAGTVKTALTNFVNTLLPIFPESEQQSHPISNWLILIAAISNNMAPGNSFLFVPQTDVVTASDYVFRICSMGSKLQADNVITSAQATAMLNAYNADF